VPSFSRLVSRSASYSWFGLRSGWCCLIVRTHLSTLIQCYTSLLCIQEKKSNIELNFVCIEKKNKVHIFPLFQNDIFFIGDTDKILSKGLSSI
jgi:hypothetical protein